MDMQITPQVEAQKAPREYPFKPGKSGNPSGRTNMLERTRELCAIFEATHGRPPSPLDMISIRTAARLAAACQSPNTNAEQSVRASNALHKTLKRLGLASPPAKREPKSGLEKLHEALDRVNGEQR